MWPFSVFPLLLRWTQGPTVASTTTLVWPDPRSSSSCSLHSGLPFLPPPLSWLSLLSIGYRFLTFLSAYHSDPHTGKQCSAFPWTHSSAPRSNKWGKKIVWLCFFPSLWTGSFSLVEMVSGSCTKMIHLQGAVTSRSNNCSWCIFVLPL